MKGFLVAGAMLLMNISIGSCEKLGFPEGFLFGAGSSAYQMEGAWDEDGKAPSFWDHWTHEDPSRIADRSNADVSCDFYHKYKEDIQLMKQIGIDTFRLSISWARVMPDCENVNWKAIAYYKSLLKELWANGIEPLVTLYHWDHPQYLENHGGWTNKTMVTLFVKYARVVYAHLGPWIRLSSTINQIYFLCSLGYAEGTFAPGWKLGTQGELLCVHHMIQAHVATYRMYDKEFRQTQNGKVGMAISVIYFKTGNPFNLIDYPARDYAFLRSCDQIVGPIVHGDYPLKLKLWAQGISLLQGHTTSILPSFTPEEKYENKGTFDHFDLNYYYTIALNVGYNSSKGIQLYIEPSSNLTDLANGLRYVINEVKQKYKNPTIIVTENGMEDPGLIEDHKRVEFFQTMLKALRETIYKDNCKVIGYYLWSFLDGFEYVKGYASRYGIIGVDHSSPYRNRTMKRSARWWTEFLGTRDLAAVNMSNID